MALLLHLQNKERIPMSSSKQVGVAFVGCGFVADFYYNTLKHHPQLKLTGVFDINMAAAEKFAQHYPTHVYQTWQEVLNDPNVVIVANLTNPTSHRQVTEDSLRAGKHVYSEKPLAINAAEANALTGLAREKGLHLSAAPCSMLGETAQTIWKHIREGGLGDVKCVYAEMEDGMIHLDRYQKWANDSGTLWPWLDEYETGCTVEHAGYYLAWLTVMFGPAESVVAISDCLIKDKVPDGSHPTPDVADISVGVIRFKSGVIARLSCGIVAPHDHSLRIVGDKATLEIKDSWNYEEPIYLRKWLNIKGKRIEKPWREKLKLVRKPGIRYAKKASHQMDFSRGIAEVADAILENRKCRLSMDLCHHINEITYALQNAGPSGVVHKMVTTFEPIEPMQWAK
jgi:predicted dehydrogenase